MSKLPNSTSYIYKIVEISNNNIQGVKITDKAIEIVIQISAVLEWINGEIGELMRSIPGNTFTKISIIVWAAIVATMYGCFTAANLEGDSISPDLDYRDVRAAIAGAIWGMVLGVTVLLTVGILWGKDMMGLALLCMFIVGQIGGLIGWMTCLTVELTTLGMIIGAIGGMILGAIGGMIIGAIGGMILGTFLGLIILKSLKRRNK